jgi:two-component system, OmpR family, heavy metal sensor histidine kinase CusS
MLRARWHSYRIRTRLALACVLALMLIVTINAAVVLWLSYRDLSQQIDRSLARDIEAGAAWVQSALQMDGQALKLALITRTADDAGGHGAIEAYAVEADGSTRLVITDAPALVLPLPDTGMHDGRRGVVSNGDGEAFYSLAVARTVDGRPFMLRAMRPVAAVTSPLADLAGRLALALPLVLGIAWFGARLVAGQLLWPLQRLIRRARSLQPGLSADRLPQTGPDDELRDLNTVINRMLDQVQASMQRERNFADDVAHELRTPLTAQITRAETTMSLLQRHGPADPHEAVHSMLDEARHMQRLITGLLTLTRVSTQSEAVALQAVDVVAVAEDCVELLQVLAEEKKQSLQVLCHDRPLAQAEPTMLRQALMNIVHNAIDHCGSGAQIAVRIAAASPPQHGDPARAQVVVAVEDDGPGIAPDQLKHVFQRFFRGHGSRRPRSERGLGLGLAIAKALTEAQGGCIGVDSVVPRGTRFVLSFSAHPLAPPRPRVSRQARALLRYNMAIAGGDAGFRVMTRFNAASSRRSAVKRTEHLGGLSAQAVSPAPRFRRASTWWRRRSHRRTTPAAVRTTASPAPRRSSDRSGRHATSRGRAEGNA